MSDHAELPPSSSDKWILCHAWRRLNHGLPDTTSEAAEEGTIAHEWLEKCLQGDAELTDIPDEEMQHHITEVFEFIQSMKGESEVFSEQKVDFGSQFGFVDLGGTSDLIGYDEEILWIADLKYGRQVVECSASNYQLMTYLSGAVAKFGKRKKYKLWILQPRAYHQDGPFRSCTVTKAQLANFNRKLEKAVQGNYDFTSEATAGKHCFHYCKALGGCRAAARRSLKLFEENPVDVS